MHVNSQQTYLHNAICVKMTIYTLCHCCMCQVNETSFCLHMFLSLCRKIKMTVHHTRNVLGDWWLIVIVSSILTIILLYQLSDNHQFMLSRLAIGKISNDAWFDHRTPNITLRGMIKTICGNNTFDYSKYTLLTKQNLYLYQRKMSIESQLNYSFVKHQLDINKTHYNYLKTIDKSANVKKNAKVTKFDIGVAFWADITNYKYMYCAIYKVASSKLEPLF